jgi:DNA-binding response OmpR family regulator
VGDTGSGVTVAAGRPPAPDGSVPASVRVLVVDDDPIVRDVLVRYLRHQGFDVATAEDGEAAIAAVGAARPHVVLLDLMLPKVDGLEVFRRIQGPDAPAVIMLTAKGEEIDRVVGLELGADDYVTKPFSPREVVARVRTILRRIGARTGAPTGLGSSAVIEAGEIRIDGRAREVRRGDRLLRLTPKEFDLLLLLASNPRRVFSRIEILEELWDLAFDGDPATVTVHVRRLREKLEADPSHPRHLVTVWSAGYRFDP